MESVKKSVIKFIYDTQEQAFFLERFKSCCDPSGSILRYKAATEPEDCIRTDRSPLRNFTVLFYTRETNWRKAEFFLYHHLWQDAKPLRPNILAFLFICKDL